MRHRRHRGGEGVGRPPPRPWPIQGGDENGRGEDGEEDERAVHAGLLRVDDLVRRIGEHGEREEGGGDGKPAPDEDVEQGEDSGAEGGGGDAGVGFADGGGDPQPDRHEGGEQWRLGKNMSG